MRNAVMKKAVSLALVLALLSGCCGGALADVLMLPGSLTEIGESAFEGDASLDEVGIPDGVLSIGARAFANSSVGVVNLPPSLTYIAPDAFDNTPRAVFYADRGTYAYTWLKDNHRLLRFSDDYAYDVTVDMAIFEADDEVGLYSDSFVYYFGLADEGDLREELRGEPVWTARQVDGPESSYQLMKDGCAASLLVDMPAEPATTVYEVTCAWDGQQVKSRVTVRYVYPASLPQGADVPYFITLIPNRDNVIPMSFQPAYSFGNADRIGLENYAGAYSYDYIGHEMHITPYEEGTFTANIALYAGNMYLWRSVVFRVASPGEGLNVTVEASWVDCYTLSWNPVDGVENYTVSAFADEACTEFRFGGETDEPFIYLNTDVGERYWFMVEYELNGQTHRSEPVTAQPVAPLPAPRNLRAEVDAMGMVHLTWDAVENTVGYRIYFSDQPEWTVDTEWFSYQGEPGNAELYLEPGAVMYIWVCADNWDGPNLRSFVTAKNEADPDDPLYLLEHPNEESLYLENMVVEELSLAGETDQGRIQQIQRINQTIRDYNAGIQAYNAKVEAFYASRDSVTDFLSTVSAEETDSSVTLSVNGVTYTVSGDMLHDLTDDVTVVSTQATGNGFRFELQGANKSGYLIVSESGSPALRSTGVNRATPYVNPNHPLSVMDAVWSAMTKGLDAIVDELTGLQGYYDAMYTEAASFSELIDNIRNIPNKLEAVSALAAGLKGLLKGIDTVNTFNKIGEISDKISQMEEILGHWHPTGYEYQHQESRYIGEKVNDYANEAIMYYNIYRVFQLALVLEDWAQYICVVGGPGFAIADLALKIVIDITKNVAFNELESMADDTYNQAVRRENLLHYIVSGEVKDKDTQEPLEGVTIQCSPRDEFNVAHDPMTFTTGENGAYYFEPLGNTVQLLFTKEGYSDLSVKLPESGKTIEQDEIYVYPAEMESTQGKIYGKVTDTDHQPLENVKVTCGDVTVYTDANGDYSFKQAPGDYTLVFSLFGYKEREVPLIITVRASTQVNMPLESVRIIRTRAELEAIGSGDYVLGNSIYLDDGPWTPLPWFSGTLDGNGYGIIGMEINGSFDGNIGLFGGLNGATIKNLFVTGEIDVTGGAAYMNVGMIAGNSLGTELKNVSASGSITVTGGAGGEMLSVGGLMGLGKADITDGASEVNISTNYSRSTYAGGLVGRLNSGTINGGYYNGAVEVKQSTSNASMEYLGFGTTFTESQAASVCVVEGSVRVETIDGLAHAGGLGFCKQGENRASVTAVSQRGQTIAIGCEACDLAKNTGDISASSTVKGNVYAVGVTGQKGKTTECENHGNVSASAAWGDSLAVGMDSCGGSTNTGAVVSVCGRGNAIGQGLNQCDDSLNEGALTVTYQGANGAAGGLSAHGLDQCTGSVNKGYIKGVIESTYTQPTVAGVAGGGYCANYGTVECQSASGPAVAYGVGANWSQNYGVVRAVSSGNDSNSAEAYAVASGIADGYSECLNEGNVAASASHGGARAYGYGDNCGACVSRGAVAANSTYYKTYTENGKTRYVRGAAYAYNSVSVSADTQGFSVMALYGESKWIYYFFPQCDTHEGQTPRFISNDKMPAEFDSCYLYLGGAYSVESGEYTVPTPPN